MIFMKQYPEKMSLKEVWTHFEAGGLVHLATLDGDQPRVRAMALTAFDNQLWVVTHTSDKKVDQIRKNPHVEFTYTVPGKGRTGCLRANAKAIVITDPKMRRAVADVIPWFNGYWKSAEDPEYTLIKFELNTMLFDHHESRNKYTIEL